MRFGNGTLYQTMDNLSAIILKKEKFPNGANIILLSIKSNRMECSDVKKSSKNMGETQERYSRKTGTLKTVSSGFT